MSKNDDFKDYLMQEYESVAKAHLTTIETIATFFRNYLVIMTIPLALVGFLIQKTMTDTTTVTIENESRNSKSVQIQQLQTDSSSIYIKNTNTTTKTSPTSTILVPQPNVAGRKKQAENLSPFVKGGGIALVAISLAGLALMLYVINLRLDAVLYAKTVNGIRKYFYDKADIPMSMKLNMRTLPQTTAMPSYIECYFVPVIIVFALINTLYLFFGATFLMYSAFTVERNTTLISLCYSILHFILYWCLAAYRTDVYLRSNIIGVDIDGVLNKHREVFCQMLFTKTGIKLNPDQIVHIPVDELNLGVTRDDTKKVFNSPEYWVNMIKADNTDENVKKLKNGFKLKVMIFTHRPWPNVANLTKEQAKELYKLWRNQLADLELDVLQILRASQLNIIYKQVLYTKHHINRLLINRFRKKSLINSITMAWLKKYGFQYDSLVIEKMSEDVPAFWNHKKSRFSIAKRRKIKYFVEDDLEKAIKLSFTCDVVYLIDHPYNQSISNMPGNIVRVRDWNQLYKEIRKIY